MSKLCRRVGWGGKISLQTLLGKLPGRVSSCMNLNLQWSSDYWQIVSVRKWVKCRGTGCRCYLDKLLPPLPPPQKTICAFAYYPRFRYTIHNSITENVEISDEHGTYSHDNIIKSCGCDDCYRLRDLPPDPWNWT